MRIGFFSTMGGLPWGGSEELWSRAAHVLLERGHEVAFSSRRWRPTAEPIERLIAAGAEPTFQPKRRLGRTLRRTFESLRMLRLKHVGWLRKTRPDLVVISFSCHVDDPQIANTCRLLGVPYAIVLQAAGANMWIPPRSLADFQAAYRGARQSYFVSNENRELLESNLGIDLSTCEIVDNPFAVRGDAAPAWPAAEPRWRLACVARFHFQTKSQDLLLRVLRAPKWRRRSLEVNLWGNDNGDLAQTRRLIELYQLGDQVRCAGFATDVEALWAEHHALLLPSRVEGNALSLIEAMLCGRVPIVTNVGRASELIDDNQSGFIAPAATVELIDEALERAWQRREEWQAIGARAAAAIRARHSLRPAEDFADRLTALVEPQAATRRLAA
jgi:glycosyltransferase involved in cell wall biosynthesis